ncbi:hypothetical protein [Streptomyces microflavus]|uniref:hypothetical protein n=1 Tax=Streptomyces microflavus TaxID=1919 RepID=UPI00345234D6
MQLIFIDDSGQQSPPREHLGELASVGAVMFPEDEVAASSRQIDELRTELGMPADEEFKWNSSGTPRRAVSWREPVARR